MNAAPDLIIDDIALFERPVRLRLPFRFGVVTLTETPQAFVRVAVRLPDGRTATGAAAELMVPKWFDKAPDRSNAQNVDQLRCALRLARDAYLDGVPRSAFGHFAAQYQAQIDRAGALGLNPLVANFGPALIDRAVLDALGRGLALPFAELIRRNLAGLRPDPALVPDLAGDDLAGFLAGLAPVRRIAARHTVGLVDALTEAEIPSDARLDDGLPESLEAALAAYGHRWVKLKVAGDVAGDLDRLGRIAAVLDRQPAPYRATLDGNEQYRTAEAVLELWRRIAETPRLARLAASIAYIEQPIHRDATFREPVTALAAHRPVIVDEADATLDAFPRARALGYAGISSKTCKGVYKSILNAARAAAWSRAGTPCFLSAEDLTTQAGLAVQQDLALVGLLGLEHVERNGHHYVDGFGGAPAAEADGFLAAHPDLYHRAAGGRVRLTIADGWLALGTLATPGFAAGAHPDFASLSPLA